MRAVDCVNIIGDFVHLCIFCVKTFCFCRAHSLSCWMSVGFGHRMLRKSFASVDLVDACTWRGCCGRRCLKMKLDQLIRQGMVTVHFQDDDNLEKTQSLLSDILSMREEMEAMHEENRLLREAMEQQTQLQQDVLARFVG